MKAIKAEPLEIRKLFSGEHEFIIPEFQRPYSWDTENCDKLWEDIEFFIDSCIDKNNKNDQYFLGSIVIYRDEKNKDVWFVVDGQQRLTTLFLLIKALHNSNVSYPALGNMIYKKDKRTDEPSKDLRLQSKVQTEISSDFESIMKDGKLSNPKSKSPFKLNYEKLESHLDTWIKNEKNLGKCADFIESLLDQVVLLPIECASEEDALTLFQIVNDRGAQLSDADIFKAKIYKAAGKDNKSFIERWKGLGNSDIDNLFRNFMHVSRAKHDDTSKEIALRKYMDENHLGRDDNLESNWDNIVCNLENTRKIYKENVCSDEEKINDDWVYWGIMAQYPNYYCQYPPIVFSHKYGKRDNGDFLIPDEKQDEYIALLKNTVRYFFIKSVVHNAVNSVKDTAYKVCCAIYHERDYIKEYEKNTAKDMDNFWRKLKESEYGKCKRGLVVLNSFLNGKQNRADYKDLLNKGKYDIEHILPQKWSNYDQWDENSYNENLDRIGNLMPLEKKCNIRASNEFFGRKQEEYKKSKVQDALDLSTKDPKTWYPEDVEKRHEESMERLRKFFGEFTRVEK